MSGLILDLRIVAPKDVAALASDDLMDTMLLGSFVSADINDVAGLKPYGIGFAVPTAGCMIVGELSSAEQQYMRWKGQQYSFRQGKIVPWIEPLRGVVKEAVHKGCYSKPIRSVVALAEGGWCTPLRALAEFGKGDGMCPLCAPLGLGVQRELAAVLRCGDRGSGAQALPRTHARTSHRSSAWSSATSSDTERPARDEAQATYLAVGIGNTFQNAPWPRTACLAHRCIACPSIHARVGEDVPFAIRKRWSANAWDPLYRRGVPGLPRVPPPPPECEEWFGMSSPLADGIMATGKGYTDGACKGFWRRARRAGWGICIVNELDSVEWALYGTCSDLLATALKAELWAVFQLLRRCPLATVSAGEKLLTIGIDNLEACKGIEAGPVYCCAANRQGADIWCRIWAIIADAGGRSFRDVGVEVKKVKAHLGTYDINAGKITVTDYIGNSYADRAAVKGALMAERLSPTQEARSHFARANAYYRWVVSIASNWAQDTALEKDDRNGPKAKPKQGQQALATRAVDTHQLLPHEVWKTIALRKSKPAKIASGGVACRLCGNTASLRTWRSFAKKPCGRRLRGLAAAPRFTIASMHRKGAAYLAGADDETERSIKQLVIELSARKAPGPKSDRQWQGAASGHALVSDPRQGDGVDCQHYLEGADALAECKQNVDAASVIIGAVVGGPVDSAGVLEVPGIISRKHLLRRLRSETPSNALMCQPLREQGGLPNSGRDGRSFARLTNSRRDPPRLFAGDSRRILKVRGLASYAAEDVDGALISLVRSSATSATQVVVGGQPRPKKARASASRPSDHAQHQDVCLPSPESLQDRSATGFSSAVDVFKDGGIVVPELRAAPLVAAAGGDQRTDEAASDLRRPVPLEEFPVSVGHGHRLCRSGSIVWCSSCAAFAEYRIGKRLQARCTGSVPGRHDSRLKLLRLNLHPINGLPLF